VLWNMRAASALEFYTDRKKKNPTERFSIFTAECAPCPSQRSGFGKPPARKQTQGSSKIGS
jgi:hypothetical protein